MPRLRPIVAVLAGACLIAPAAAAVGVGVHLEWAEHHEAGHHHPHDPVPLDEPAHEHTPAADRHLDPAPHSHSIPKVVSEPAVPRGQNARASIRIADADRVSASAPDRGAPEARSGRPPDSRPPDRSAPSPDLVHLHCALLI